MGSSVNATAASPEFCAAFSARADSAGVLRYDAFIEVALYHPRLGYYRTGRPRIGTGPGTDFLTATSAGRDVFGALVCAACVHLLGNRDPREHEFVEIGADRPAGVLAEIVHPFRNARTVRVGESIELSGSMIVFSNELFDAQPFRRFRRIAGRWHELAVQLRDGMLREISKIAPASLPFVLPDSVVDGYTIDAPIASAALAHQIAAQPWNGLFVACDYGKSWEEIANATPAGTARAYSRHRQHQDLLSQPGEQDLTCHICWDWLSDALRRNGFTAPRLDSQESFFIRHAESYIAPAIAIDAAHFTTRKQAISQILHGAHMGQKFQVLHGLR